MATFRPKSADRPAQPAEPIAEIYRRVVRIHASMAEATDDDRDIRRWGVTQLMELARYIESLSAADQARDQPAASSR